MLQVPEQKLPSSPRTRGCYNPPSQPLSAPLGQHQRLGQAVNEPGRSISMMESMIHMVQPGTLDGGRQGRPSRSITRQVSEPTLPYEDTASACGGLGREWHDGRQFQNAHVGDPSRYGMRL